MTTRQWYRFFRMNGNGALESLRKAWLIRRAKSVRVFPITRR